MAWRGRRIRNLRRRLGLDPPGLLAELAGAGLWTESDLGQWEGGVSEPPPEAAEALEALAALVRDGSAELDPACWGLKPGPRWEARRAPGRPAPLELSRARLHRLLGTRRVPDPATRLKAWLASRAFSARARALEAPILE